MRLAFGFSLLLAVLAMALTGCGGGSGGSESAKGAEGGCDHLSTESQREECLKQQASKQIPGADRVAYYQLAITAGLLRADGVAAARSAPLPPQAGRAELSSAQARIAQLQPRDAALKQVLRRIRGLVGLTRAGLSPVQAHQVLASLDRINRILQRYVATREPAQAALIPD